MNDLIDLKIKLDDKYPINLTITVSLGTFGSYSPASLYHPAEYPETEWKIDSVWHKGKSLTINYRNQKRLESWVEFELEKRGII